jgi:predicted esterase
MGRTFVWVVIGGAFSGALAPACSDGGVVRDAPPGIGTAGKGAGGTNNQGEGGEGGMPEIPVGKSVGEACSAAEPCRIGLICDADDECAPAGETPAGEACVIGAECDDGQCIEHVCEAAGPGAEGEQCASDAQCAAGLRCSVVGLGLVCAPEGTGDWGAACSTSADCFAGLVCWSGACAIAPLGGDGPVFGEPWPGVECDEPVETGVKAYFEVPGAAGADEGDFFRLPFPTDVRRAGNKLDLSGFPTPGDKLLGVDPVQLYVDAITENDSGWGTYPTVIFRFSGPFLFGTFARDAVQFIDVTEPAQGRNVGWQRFYTDGRSNYVCDNFVAVQPPTGSPLEPGHTYAVYIVSEANGLTLLERGEQHEDPAENCSIDGADGTPVCDVPVGRSQNMAAVLAAAVPADPALKAAHGAFSPLRAYLAAKGLPTANVLTASVFTVGEVRAPMTELAAAVAASAPPVARNWVKCGGAAVSPCPQAEDERACADDVDGYDEYQALLAIPVYQQGRAPYLTPADGGGVDISEPRTEEVCLSITVPEDTPPDAGWPTVVFAHGTGGSFRSHVRPEVSGVLAAATPKFAVIGIDQVEHGPRRGNSTESPNNLFFNFLNPAATRGNPLQGAADQLSVARFAKALNVDAATTGGSAIKLDPTKLYFFGHSQGATEGSLMLPYGDDYQAAVLSGNGASLRDALRTKTRPENVAAALPIVLQDPSMLDPGLGAGISANHPVLSLLQQWIDPADPLNFAAIIGAPLQGHAGKHVLQPFGVGDTYSPPLTLATFALAAGITQVDADESAKPVFDTFFDKRLAPVPVGYRAPGSGITLGMRQYGAPNGSDGHFVVFDTQAANDDMVLFLTSATGATPPVIGQ